MQSKAGARRAIAHLCTKLCAIVTFAGMPHIASHLVWHKAGALRYD